MKKDVICSILSILFPSLSLLLPLLAVRTDMLVSFDLQVINNNRTCPSL